LLLSLLKWKQSTPPPNSFSKDLKWEVLAKQYLSIDVLSLLNSYSTILDSQSKIFMITENNEPVGTLNWDQIIAALSEGKYDVRSAEVAHEKRTKTPTTFLSRW
jgi:ABC-type amino acid transport substrate-binding protein